MRRVIAFNALWFLCLGAVLITGYGVDFPLPLMFMCWCGGISTIYAGQSILDLTHPLSPHQMGVVR